MSNKHDAACLERRQRGANVQWLCTCGLSDQVVRDAYDRGLSTGEVALAERYSVAEFIDYLHRVGFHDVAERVSRDRQIIVIRPDLITCPACNGKPQMTGDGSGWDGAHYHSPPCEVCGDRGEVEAVPQTEESLEHSTYLNDTKDQP